MWLQVVSMRVYDDERAYSCGCTHVVVVDKRVVNGSVVMDTHACGDGS